jgi:hypothetical protein
MLEDAQDEPSRRWLHPPGPKVWADKEKFHLDIFLWIRAFERRSGHTGSINYYLVLITLPSTIKSGQELHLERHGI